MRKKHIENDDISLRRLRIALEGHTAIMGVERSKELNEIMTILEEKILLGSEETGYIEVELSQKSVDEIWPIYEQLYDAIRNVEYEFIGDVVDLTELKRARDDNRFQSMLSSLAQINAKD